MQQQTAHVKFFTPFCTGAFSAIKNAFDESTDAAKKVNASEKTTNESADVREETENLHKPLQPVNTKDLQGLNQSMASGPDLTPVAKEVMNGFMTLMQC